MHILENSFHRRRFIDISASFTPHSDSERLLNSELLFKIQARRIMHRTTLPLRFSCAIPLSHFVCASLCRMADIVLPF